MSLGHAELNLRTAQLLMTRKWEMPNGNTFDIKCIKEFIFKYHKCCEKENMLSIDPFANKNRIAVITNDLES